MVQSYSPGRGNVAIPRLHIGATWRIRSNLCILRPTAVHNQNGKSIGAAVFAQLAAESAWLYFTMGAPIHQDCPFPSGIRTPIYHMITWAHASPCPKWHLDRFSRFCTDDRRVSLYITTVRPSPPLKIAPSHEGIRTHVTSASLGPPESSTKRYLDRFYRFCREMPGITSVTD